MKKLALATMMTVALTLLPGAARAEAYGVGLGVAGGVAYSGTKLENMSDALGSRFAWGFFVDIPLLATFYITPATMLYELDLGTRKTQVTDVDINFKFIVPIGAVHFGAGLTAGLTVGIADKYVPHYGVLGVASMNLVANLDAFVMAQYKKVLRDDVDIDDIHGYAGGMFHF